MSVTGIGRAEARVPSDTLHTVRRKAPCDEHLPAPVSTVPRLGNPHVARVHSRPPSPAAVTVMALGVAQRSATLSNLCG